MIRGENANLIICFPKDVKVTMADGRKVPIGLVKVGDDVLSFNVKTKLIEAKRVVRLYVRKHNGPLVKIEHESGSLTCTPNHRIYVGNDMEKIPALKLNTSSQLWIVNGPREQSTIADSGTISLWRSTWRLVPDEDQKEQNKLGTVNRSFLCPSRIYDVQILANARVHGTLTHNSPKPWMGNRTHSFDDTCLSLFYGGEIDLLSERQEEGDSALAGQNYESVRTRNLVHGRWEPRQKIWRDENRYERFFARGKFTSYQLAIREMGSETICEGRHSCSRLLPSLSFFGTGQVCGIDKRIHHTFNAVQNTQGDTESYLPCLWKELRPEKKVVWNSEGAQVEDVLFAHLQLAGSSFEKLSSYLRVLRGMRNYVSKNGESSNVQQELQQDVPAFAKEDLQTEVFNIEVEDNHNYFADDVLVANCDEAAFIPEDVILSVLTPMLATTDGILIMLSTPWDKCYSEDTDVMTQGGWEKISNITKQTRVACLIDDRVQYCNPEEIFAQESEEMIEFASSKINLCVTPNHRMYVRKQKEKIFGFKRARDLVNFRGDLYFRTGFPWISQEEREFFELPGCDWFHIAGGRKGETVNNKPRVPRKIKMDDWLEFFGYWLSEGTVVAREKEHAYFVSISQSLNEKGINLSNKIADSIRRIGFRPRIQRLAKRERAPNGEIRVVVSNKQLALYLSKLDGHKSIPKEIKNLSNRQIRILFDAIYGGDGRQLEGRQNQIYCGIYEKYANDVQELCLKLGFSSSIWKARDFNCWIVSVLKNPVHKYTSFKHPPTLIHERQRSYCLTVPGGLVFVRRKGHCCWSGNSHFFYRAYNLPYWSKHKFKTDDNPLVKKEYLERMREEVGERRFKQEYLGEFVDDEDTYFPMDLIRPCIHVCADMREEETCKFCETNSGKEYPVGGELYGGYDPGGLTDPAALVVVQKVKEGSDETSEKIGKDFRPAFRVVLTKTFLARKGLKDEDVYTKFNVAIADIQKKSPMKKVLVDCTGIGNPILSHCKQLGIPVEGLTMHRKSEEELFSNLKILLERKKVELPDNMELISSLNSIVSERSRTGGYSFTHASGTHDDLAYALALAVLKAGKGTGTIIAHFSSANVIDDGHGHGKWV
jgi:hypothetical protein